VTNEMKKNCYQFELSVGVAAKLLAIDAKLFCLSAEFEEVFFWDCFESWVRKLLISV